MQTTLVVQNLRCGGCSNTITSKLLEIKNIENLKVDIDASKIHFDYYNKIDLQAVKDKLKALGYPEVDDKNSMLFKAKSIVSCATGKFKK
jgi:copper chaperone CopZ